MQPPPPRHSCQTRVVITDDPVVVVVVVMVADAAQPTEAAAARLHVSPRRATGLQIAPLVSAERQSDLRALACVAKEPQANCRLRTSAPQPSKGFWKHTPHPFSLPACLRRSSLARSSRALGAEAIVPGKAKWHSTTTSAFPPYTREGGEGQRRRRNPSPRTRTAS